eukprot:6458412-Amphidinium_carterae.1
MLPLAYCPLAPAAASHPSAQSEYFRSITAQPQNILSPKFGAPNYAAQDRGGGASVLSGFYGCASGSNLPLDSWT